MPGETSPTIRFANFLSPLLQETYTAIAQHVGRQTRRSATLYTGKTLEEFARGQADAGFLCGLLYVGLADEAVCPVELLAAPVLEGERYRGEPVYFSDVVVRRERAYQSLDDLAGCTWAYNERASHSGCNVVCYGLLTRDKTPDYFGQTVKSGSHMASLRMVIDGQADATALDSHVLDVLLDSDPAVAEQIRIIDSFGPSTIPPIVVARTVDDRLKQHMREIFLSIHRHPDMARALHQGHIARFVEIDDARYHDIRAMTERVRTTTFPFV